MIDIDELVTRLRDATPLPRHTVERAADAIEALQARAEEAEAALTLVGCISKSELRFLTGGGAYRQANVFNHEREDAVPLYTLKEQA